MLQQFVLDLGARPTHIDAAAHDRIMAVVSHLPHVLANVLMDHTGTLPGAAASGPCTAWAPASRTSPGWPAPTRPCGATSSWRTARPWRRRCARSRRSCRSSRHCSSRATRARILDSIDSAAAYREELLEYEDITPATLYKVTVRVPDQPGVVSKVMTALGQAEINVEDLTLHHFSRSVGGDLVLFIDGRDVAETAAALAPGSWAMPSRCRSRGTAGE